MILSGTIKQKGGMDGVQAPAERTRLPGMAGISGGFPEARRAAGCFSRGLPGTFYGGKSAAPDYSGKPPL